MNEPNERKDQRRQNFFIKNNKKNDFAEDQRFVSKFKKERKKKIENLRGEEVWEDWEDWQGLGK